MAAQNSFPIDEMESNDDTATTSADAVTTDGTRPESAPPACSIGFQSGFQITKY